MSIEWDKQIPENCMCYNELRLRKWTQINQNRRNDKIHSMKEAALGCVSMLNTWQPYVTWKGLEYTWRVRRELLSLNAIE